MGKQRHVILKQTLEITVASAEEAWPLQQRISRIVNTKVQQLIGRACDNLASPDCLHRIDRLELDLGQLNPKDLAIELPAKFAEAFKRELAKAVKQQDPSGLPAMTASQLELFVQFFQQGTLPWWADLDQSGQPAGSVDYLLQEAPELLRQILPTLAAETPVLRRLIGHLEDRRLADLAVLQAPALGDFCLALFQSLFQAVSHTPRLTVSVHPPPFFPGSAAILASISAGETPTLLGGSERLRLTGIPQTRVRAHLWQSLLQHALLPESAPADCTDFARGVLLRLARLLTVSYPVLLEALSKASSGLQGPLREIADTLARELQTVQSGSTKGATDRFNVVELSRHSGMDRRNPDCRDATNPYHPWSLGSGDPCRNDGEHLNSTVLPPNPNPPPLWENLQEGRIFERNLTVLGEEEGLVLGNAGLVILWPFLGRLFKQIGLAEDQKFISESARQRGVAVLHYLATGDASPPPEYLLPLNKLLCGMEQEAVFELDGPLTEAETGECDDFLTAVIAQAPILQSMPIAGLRGNFLLRAGMLQVKQGIWLLRVERETHDVVLDHFPWEFQWVRLPWMEEPLQVEWGCD